ncbi:hypothetical protein AB6A40_006019 [Gnathostoma spinigerum]|uniref:MIF4G domain-containing protein n=1 Tax=Gnathostoma spinigerum TaxID=75299 RepID=A0ABD6EH47_9BILA
MDDEDSHSEASEVMPPVISVAPINTSKISGQDLKLMMNAFTEQLPWLINRDLIDKAALDFVTNLNTKNNRKKLCQVMLETHRDRLDLLPFYGRLVATLEPVMPDLALELSHSLIHEFKSTVQNKIKKRLDWKVRNCRFISELVKFGIIPKAEALSCLRMVLFDFRGHNIDMACAMVDSMGLFLYRSTESHGKMKILLDVMMKKRERISDPRQQMLIDNAYFTCIPPEQEAKPAFSRPPLHDFIRSLVINLSRCRAELTVRCFRRIDWTDEETAEYAIRCLSNPSLIKFVNLPYLASVVAALSSFHDYIGNAVLDNVLEEIRLGLEMNDFSMNQITVLETVYLGQLYNYSVCDSPIIFKTLYMFITYGAYDVQLDDWNNTQRLTLTCELLLTCGEYFNGGSAKKKLDCFLAYFYRYMWAKKDAFALRSFPFPKEVDYYIEEMTEYVRKGSHIPENMVEAQEMVHTVEETYKQAAEAALGKMGEEEVEESTEEDIDEEEEEVRTNASGNEEGAVDDTSPAEEESVGDYGPSSSFLDDAEEVHVHTNRVVLPEDEQFVLQLEQMIAETMQNRPVTNVTPITELTVPTAARHKFHRNIATSQTSDSPNITPSSSLSMDESQTEVDPVPRMAILTRGKGNKAVLKAITMDAPSGLKESWYAQKERERKEQSVHKHITLSISERMMADEEISD